MTPTEAKAWNEARREQITTDAVRYLLDMEQGWKDYAVAYLRDCIAWVVDQGVRGVGPQKPPNLDPWVARGIREAVLEAETVSRMGPRP